MTPEEASATALRIGDVWPTATPEQIALAAKGLLAPEYTIAETNQAIDAMYFNGVKFFDWGDLRSRIVVKAPRPDPAVIIAPFKERELEKRREQHDRARYEAESLAYAQSLPPDELQRARAQFLATLKIHDFARGVLERMLNQGKWPASFVDWVYERRTGQAVA